MHKYEALTQHLSSVQQSHHPMSFAEIEAIIQDRLPPSAHKYRAWWSNNPSNSAMTKAWLDAGWISSDVDMEKKKLVFRRAKKRLLPSASPQDMDDNPTPPKTSASSRRHTITIGDIDETTMQALAAKARLSDATIEHVARKILEQGAPLTMVERLALADKVRSRSPQLHDVDVVKLIREDRDMR